LKTALLEDMVGEGGEDLLLNDTALSMINNSQENDAAEEGDDRTTYMKIP
jgi:hypothetical protein